MSHANDEVKEESFMIKLSTFIVDKRNLFFLLFIFALIFCAFSRNWVKVENDITAYLPETTETRQGLTLMDEQFTTFGSASVMISNITYSDADALCEQIGEINGVSKAEFDDSEDHYINTNALISVTFEGEADDEVSISAMAEIKELLDIYDVYIDSEVGNDSSAALAKDMQTVTAVAIVIIVVVLTFTSKAYAEVPILLMTFGSAALLNMGTNFLLGTISYISDSVTVVLQLALAIDYAIILIHRYSEEHETMDAREACITALSKAIPEISSSSLTTISGLIALAFMKFGIGPDLAVVLIKAILFSLLSVFTLMPGLIMLFSGLIEKTAHKNLIPSISALGSFAFRTKYVIPPLFLAVTVAAFFFANKCPYCYGTSDLEAARKSEAKITTEKIQDSFGKTNLIALVVPAGSYENEGALIKKLERCEEVDSCLGLSNVEAMDGYMLTDKLDPRQFSELIQMDHEAAQLIYAAYAINDENYGEVINGLDSYGVPLIDMFLFVYDEVQKGYVTLDSDLMDTLEDLHKQLSDAKLQLRSEEYSRILVYLNLPEEGEETFAFLDRMHEMAAEYYDHDVYLVGNSTSDRDLSSSFVTDNLVISILSALFVIIILLFTFNSAGLPLVLIAVIQGSIWMNFSFPYLQNTALFFLSYLIVNSIQMGANIDYAIVISSRYMELKQEMPLKDAVRNTLDQAFPTIVTSGTILASAGILIGQLSSDGSIASIGVCLGRGTIMSIALVMCVLPQLLLLGDSIIERTSFTLKKPSRIQRSNGAVAVNGRISGYVNGRVEAVVHGVIFGEVNAKFETQNLIESTVSVEGGDEDE